MMNKIIIGLHGLARVGKDTTANRIIGKLNLLRYGPSVQVKKATAAMFDFPEEYLYDDKLKDTIDPRWGISYREMAQKVGNESSRKIFGDDFWLRHVKLFLDTKLPKPYSGIILADIRYPNEVEWVKNNNGKVIFITRKNKPTISNDNHDSEKGLDPKLADFIIDNNSTFDNLYSQVDEIINTQWEKYAK